MSVIPADIESSTVRPGSAGHRRLLARFFLDTHVEYVPERIAWPALTEAELARLTGLPFWQEAVSTENVTSNTVAAAADIEPDPQVRLRRPGMFWHLGKVLFERYWMGEGLERVAAQTALALGARALGVPDLL